MWEELVLSQESPLHSWWLFERPCKNVSCPGEMMDEETSCLLTFLAHRERLFLLRPTDHHVGPTGEFHANCSSLSAACWDSTSLPDSDYVGQLFPGSGGLCPDWKSMGDLCRLQWMASVPEVQGSAGCLDHSWHEVWGYKEHSKNSCKLPRPFVLWGLRSLWTDVLAVSRRICILPGDTSDLLVWVERCRWLYHSEGNGDLCSLVPASLPPCHVKCNI